MPDHDRSAPDKTKFPMPSEFQHDLTPDFQGGENHGLAGPHPEKSAHPLTAYDIKAITQEFTALASMVAGPDIWYVLKSSVGYILWNTLCGVTNSARLDEDDMPPPDAQFPGT